MIMFYSDTLRAKVELVLGDIVYQSPRWIESQAYAATLFSPWSTPRFGSNLWECFV